MPKYDRSVIEYVTAVYPLRISFPKDRVVCDLCPFCHAENSGTRFRCTETGEILPYHNQDIGLRCPLDGITQHNTTNNDEEEI